MKTMTMIKRWPVLGSERLLDFPIFRLRKDRCVSPRTGAEHDFVIIEAPDWVNVIALTPEENVLVISQYRFGSGEVTLEIPGGMVDEGEDPAEAARRELREETGYEAEDWVALGSIAPNPAILTNRCYTYLARGCRPVGAAALDEREDIAVEEIGLSRIPALLAEGAITHALVGIAFQKLDLFRRGLLASSPGPARR
jgi:8-oxo-dGTP pyrophosphatase MutT (NUDIX family)